MVKWPTKEDPQRVYKFTSLWLEQSLTERVIERQTYSMLEFIGDVGGLFDGLSIIGGAICAPFSTRAIRKLISNEQERSSKS